MNLSISHCHLGIINLQKNELEIAEIHAQKSMDLALNVDFRRGICEGYLIQSEIAARKNLKSESMLLLNKGLDGFKKLNIEEGLNYEFAGRISRLNGNLSESINYLKKGISISNEFPLYQAALYFEMTNTEMNLGQPYSQSFDESVRLYTQCEAPKRVEMIKSLIKSSV